MLAGSIECWSAQLLPLASRLGGLCIHKARQPVCIQCALAVQSVRSGHSKSYIAGASDCSLHYQKKNVSHAH